MTTQQSSMSRKRAAPSASASLDNLHVDGQNESTLATLSSSMSAPAHKRLKISKCETTSEVGQLSDDNTTASSSYLSLDDQAHPSVLTPSPNLDHSSHRIKNHPVMALNGNPAMVAASLSGQSSTSGCVVGGMQALLPAHTDSNNASTNMIDLGSEFPSLHKILSPQQASDLALDAKFDLAQKNYDPNQTPFPMIFNWAELSAAANPMVLRAEALKKQERGKYVRRDSLSTEQAADRRRRQNRESARRTRDRVRKYITVLEMYYTHVQKVNSLLIKQLEVMAKHCTNQLPDVERNALKQYTWPQPPSIEDCMNAEPANIAATASPRKSGDAFSSCSPSVREKQEITQFKTSPPSHVAHVGNLSGTAMKLEHSSLHTMPLSALQLPTLNLSCNTGFGLAPTTMSIPPNLAVSSTTAVKRSPGLHGNQLNLEGLASLPLAVDSKRQIMQNMNHPPSSTSTSQTNTATRNNSSLMSQFAASNGLRMNGARGGLLAPHNPLAPFERELLQCGVSINPNRLPVIPAIPAIPRVGSAPPIATTMPVMPSLPSLPTNAFTLQLMSSANRQAQTNIMPSSAAGNGQNIGNPAASIANLLNLQQSLPTHLSQQLRNYNMMNGK